MDVDDFLQEKRAAEAKERLEEAKKKLREEKERLREELKKQKETARSERFQSAAQHPDDRHIQSRSLEAGLKPWMLWDLIVLGLVLILFILGMIYPRPGADTTQQKALEDKVTALQNQLNDLKANFTPKAAAQKKSASPLITAPETEAESTAPIPLVDITGYAEDTAGNRAAEIEVNGTEIKYSLVIESLSADNQVCKIDRLKDGELTQNFAANVIVKAKEKDKSTYSVTEKGSTNFIYNIRCAYAKYNDEQKLVPVSGYSRELEVKLKTILN